MIPRIPPVPQVRDTKLTQKPVPTSLQVEPDAQHTVNEDLSPSFYLPISNVPLQRPLWDSQHSLLSKVHAA